MKSLALHPSSPRLVDRIEIAAPCHAKWEDMVGDQRARFCGQCAKNVYNVSFMSADEVEALITQTEGRACLRLYKRKDGTVMTADCPVGLAERAYRKARRATLGAIAMVITLMAGLYAALFKTTCELPGDERVVMGEMVALPLPPSDPSMPMMGAPVPVQMPEPVMGKPMAPPAKMGRMKIVDER